MAKLQKLEEEIRLACDPKRDIVESKDDIKKMLMEKTKLDHECDLKLARIQVTSQVEAEQITMVERTKVMDTLYLKYKLKF